MAEPWFHRLVFLNNHRNYPRKRAAKPCTLECIIVDLVRRQSLRPGCGGHCCWQSFHGNRQILHDVGELHDVLRQEHVCEGGAAQSATAIEAAVLHTPTVSSYAIELAIAKELS